MIKKLMRSIEKRKKRQKLPTISDHMVWNRQPFWTEANQKFGFVKGIPDIRLYFLQSVLRSLENVEGDIAECGVRYGKSALFMHDVLIRPRHIYLFDSFEGLSEPTEGKDIKSAVDPKTGKRRFALENLDEVLSRFEGKSITALKGWIPDRFLEVADKTFALVHVDVDFYQPTLDALEFFYERMPQYAILICDDYGSGNFPGARDAMDEFFAKRPENIIELPQGQGFIVKH
ncbi:MAG: TylF/MycF/NovP-related O-methyltransferase [Pseudomonadota bacterium]